MVMPMSVLRTEPGRDRLSQSPSARLTGTMDCYTPAAPLLYPRTHLPSFASLSSHLFSQLSSTALRRLQRRRLRRRSRRHRPHRGVGCGRRHRPVGGPSCHQHWCHSYCYSCHSCYSRRRVLPGARLPQPRRARDPAGGGRRGGTAGGGLAAAGGGQREGHGERVVFMFVAPKRYAGQASRLSHSCLPDVIIPATSLCVLLLEPHRGLCCTSTSPSRAASSLALPAAVAAPAAAPPPPPAAAAVATAAAAAMRQPSARCWTYAAWRRWRRCGAARG